MITHIKHEEFGRMTQKVWKKRLVYRVKGKEKHDILTCFFLKPCKTVFKQTTGFYDGPQKNII